MNEFVTAAAIGAVLVGLTATKRICKKYISKRRETEK